MPFFDPWTWKLGMLKGALRLWLSISVFLQRIPRELTVHLHEQYLGLAAQMRSLSCWIVSKFEKESSKNSAHLECKDEETVESMCKVN